MKKLFYNKTFGSILLFLITINLLVVPVVFAVEDYVPLSPLPGTLDSSGKTTNLGAYLPGAFNLLIGMALVLAVLMIIFGGVQYMSTDAVYGKKDGKERINAALLGLLIVLGAFLLLQTIDPNIVSFDIINKTPDTTKSP